MLSKPFLAYFYCCYLLHVLRYIICSNQKNPNIKETPNIIYSFVDQNGNFYPNKWQKTFANPPNNAKKMSIR